jgi:hypothetical protein
MVGSPTLHSRDPLCYLCPETCCHVKLTYSQQIRSLTSIERQTPPPPPPSILLHQNAIVQFYIIYSAEGASLQNHQPIGESLRTRDPTARIITK